ncbi:unnamed protein product [Acanthoscelides obtectus]|nr:unnamed protein product [Acanthoscelides obtectus]CAK1636329.1 Nuclear RNA export factor 1 [Acanthoscelides obtectus]
MSFDNVKPILGAITITEANIQTGIVYKNKKMIDNVNLWHKFIIHNPSNLSRNDLLTAVLDHVFPFDLIPVSYGKDNNNSNYFLARNCAAAIQKLCKDHLIVPNPYNRSQPLRMEIILRYTTTTLFKVDVQKNISAVLEKRFDPTRRCLDLTRFQDDPDLTEFCPLGQPKIMFFVLHLSKNLIPETYILRENKIRLLHSFDALKVCISSIRSIDLGNNQIKDHSLLSPLVLYKLHHLVLDGNPLCEEYSSNPTQYMRDILNMFPHLETLDGVPLKVNDLSATRPNFLCSLEGLDLINQFLEHYFTLYDSQNRGAIQNLYHPHAMFSMNSTFHSNQASLAAYKYINRYKSISRNLKMLADFSKSSEFLFTRPAEITKALCSLPPTEHDPLSFKIDLVYHTDTTSVVCVNGVFREHPENLLDPERIYGFARTFVLSTAKILDGDVECLIINELYHVYNAFTFQRLSAFKVAPARPRPTIGVEVAKVPQSAREFRQVNDALRMITGLNADWAKK